MEEAYEQLSEFDVTRGASAASRVDSAGTRLRLDPVLALVLREMFGSVRYLERMWP